MTERVKVSEYIVQTLATCVICFLAIQTGFVCAWPSYTTALFRSNDTVLSKPMTSLEISLLGGLPNLGGLLICPFCSYAFNKFGRKYATMLFGLPYVIAWVIISVTSNIALVLFAVTLAGVGIAGQNVSLIYISEISHVSIRGALTSFSATFYFLGIMISFILGGNLSYMAVVYIHLIMSVVATLLLLLIKDSPVSLLMAGKEKEAAEAVAFYRRRDVKSKEVEAEIAKIRLEIDPKLETMLQATTDSDASAELLQSKSQLTVSSTPANEPSWRFLLRSRTSQRALIVVLTITTLTIMMGCIVIQVYAEPLFIEAVPSLPPNLCSILVALDFLIASFVCAYFVERFGRKFLLIWTSSASGVCTLLLGFQLQFHWAPHWVTALLIYIYSFVYTSGCATIPYVLTAEVFLPEVRSLCNSILFGFVWIANFVTLVIFNPLVEAVGLGLVFYLFSAVCFAGAAYSQFYVPETKGLSVTDIQKLFMKERRKKSIL